MTIQTFVEEIDLCHDRTQPIEDITRNSIGLTESARIGIATGPVYHDADSISRFLDETEKAIRYWQDRLVKKESSGVRSALDQIAFLTYGLGVEAQELGLGSEVVDRAKGIARAVVPQIEDVIKRRIGEQGELLLSIEDLR